MVHIVRMGRRVEEAPPMIRRTTKLIFSLYPVLLTLFGCGGPPELTVGTAATVPTYTVTFKTAVTGQYVSAENGGGGDVNANRAAAQGWETFTINDLNGGALQNGDL